MWNTSNRPFKALAAAITVACLGACSSSDNDDTPIFAGPADPVPSTAILNELFVQGIGRYQGDFTPMESTVDGNVTNHRFGTGDGPLCLRGGEYTMATRASDSEDLLIFLEGGGACWSALCAANEEAAPGIPAGNILDATLETNPVRDYDLGYLPYCDGSLFAGDAERDYTNDGEKEYHRGLQNLSAALDVIKREFPTPKRIVLAGNSGGGFGTIFATPLVRSLYPDADIDVWNDSGVGVSTDSEQTDVLINDWRISEFFPASICPSCYADATLNRYFNWQLDQDDKLTIAMMSTKQDQTIAVGFLMVPGPAFEANLLPAMERLTADNPGRFASFIVNGNGHTFLRANINTTIDASSANERVLSEWLQDMLSDNTAWQSVTEVDE